MTPPKGGMNLGPALKAPHQARWDDPLAWSKASPPAGPGLETKPSGPCNAPRAQSRIWGAFRAQSLASSKLSVYAVKAMTSRCQQDQGPGSQALSQSSSLCHQREGIKGCGTATPAG